MGHINPQESSQLRWAERCADSRRHDLGGKLERASASFMARRGEESPFLAAPEVCVEVRSPGNTQAEMAHKTRLYLESGAAEVWIVEEDGARQIVGSDGEREHSRFGAAF